MPNLAPQFQDLAQALRRGGICSVYIERTIRELQDHYEDLVADAISAGETPECAQARSRAALGSDRLLASRVLARDELKRWSYRHPLAAAWGRSFACAAAIPALPVMFCVDQRPLIVRWTLSVGMAMLLTGSMLLCLDAAIAIR